MFHGQPHSLIDNVGGKVGHVTTNSDQLDRGEGIVSSMHVQDGIQYRRVSNHEEGYPALPVDPSLDGGYNWLMHLSRLEQVNKG